MYNVGVQFEACRFVWFGAGGYINSNTYSDCICKNFYWKPTGDRKPERFERKSQQFERLYGLKASRNGLNANFYWKPTGDRKPERLNGLNASQRFFPSSHSTDSSATKHFNKVMNFKY